MCCGVLGGFFGFWVVFLVFGLRYWADLCDFRVFVGVLWVWFGLCLDTLVLGHFGLSGLALFAAFCFWCLAL